MAARIIFGFQLATSIAWLVMGLFERFGEGGRVCSGDLLVRKGSASEQVFKESLKAASQARGY